MNKLTGTAAINALLEGKILKASKNGNKYRMLPSEQDGGDRLMIYDESADKWVYSLSIFNWVLGVEFEEIEEYNLTFFEAMSEIGKGKKVSNECFKTFTYYSNANEDLVCQTLLGSCINHSPVPHEIRSKWRVIE